MLYDGFLLLSIYLFMTFYAQVKSILKCQTNIERSETHRPLLYRDWLTAGWEVGEKGKGGDSSMENAKEDSETTRMDEQERVREKERKWE